ncbi:MAG: PHP domain-containing protein [Clostridia bacterium]|nr:PHP domain-containing protein [Clostridia bacterium]
MIQDLHSHTYYSFCGKDSPEAIVEAAIAGGIELFGICDHNHGINFGRFDALIAPETVIPNTSSAVSLRRYYDHINLIKEKYTDRIRILRGIEVPAHLDMPKVALPADADISFFDYCLIENPDMENSIIQRDLFTFAERCGCPSVGVAHTDLFTFIKAIGEDPYRYFKRMAEQNIFWEMNVSYDSIHHYREHPYMLEFFRNEEQQAIVRESGVRLSVGFDGHRVEDYLPERVADYCRRITAMGIKLAFEE